MRYVITFAYDGSKFNGYEKQPGLKTVEQAIEEVLTELNNKPVKIHASGRTDKGVHAKNQVAHFDLDVTPTLYGLKKLLNKRLKKEIYIKDVITTNDAFHARYDVLEKQYNYYINTDEYNVFQKDYVYQYNKQLDIEKMQLAIKNFIGTHDFRSFCKENKVKINCKRTITKATVKKTKDYVIISFTANGFLRKMVRNMVSLLIEIGSGKKDIASIEKMLTNPGKINQTKDVPGCGLYLEKVRYKRGAKND